jgi:hypothetical protein
MEFRGIFGGCTTISHQTKASVNPAVVSQHSPITFKYFKALKLNKKLFKNKNSPDPFSEEKYFGEGRTTR